MTKVLDFDPKSSMFKATLTLPKKCGYGIVSFFFFVVIKNSSKKMNFNAPNF